MPLCFTPFKLYVDDIFAIVEAGKEELLLECHNSLFPSFISITLEKETRNQLSFLDTLMIIRRPECTSKPRHHYDPLRNDKIKVPSDEKLDVVNKIKFGCNVSYTVETGNTLFHKFKYR
ncbi:hypothetical protein M514_06455 [Trichuris suis]|uniref:Reverse transcriptase domain-containing protein n=1 Tax=Trichuris suis TaxID=68888 RepID=A0A085N208_9BILA|nr:hypothetical protein M513_06455 [Trichuris suis]KFD63504.1 hypothetical protein M514_06455 [Trichuris suis]